MPSPPCRGPPPPYATRSGSTSFPPLAAPAPLDIAATNGRVVLAIALGAWSASRLPALRPVVDLVTATVVLGNTVLVGVAAGAYGSAATPWLVHLPLEWAAIALVAGLHRLGHVQPLAALPAVKAATAALLLVGVGAAVETYLTPQA